MWLRICGDLSLSLLYIPSVTREESISNVGVRILYFICTSILFHFSLKPFDHPFVHESI